MTNNRKLYVIPIIHAKSDMGSMASFLEAESLRSLGERVWEQHTGVVEEFWKAIAQFFSSLNEGEAKGLKIYQDGLVADGPEGIKIVREAAKKGSKNYQIIEELIDKGAILIRTEDISVVKEEYAYIIAISKARTPREKERATIRYREAQAVLLQRRDRFIAKQIKETLRVGEKGALFIGAYHNILRLLPEDIEVVQVKDLDNVRKYQKLLTSPLKNQNAFQELDNLGRYLASPIIDRYQNTTATNLVYKKLK
ncbi:MAG: hypothetical protein ABFC86_07200 [Rectinema sp.]